MRIFPDCVSCIDETVREVFSRGMIAFDPTVQGIRVEEKEYSAKELIGYTYSILDGSDKEKLIWWAKQHFPFYDATLEWAEAWFRDRVSGKYLNPEPSVKLRWNYWKAFADAFDGRFAYTYPERMCYQLEPLVEKLRGNRYMRGAMLAIWDPHKDVRSMGVRRVPCSISYHFLIRNEAGVDKMRLIYYIRSQDLVNHFPSDVYCALRLQEWMAEKVGDCELGPFISYVDSLHCYRKDVLPDRQW